MVAAKYMSRRMSGLIVSRDLKEPRGARLRPDLVLAAAILAAIAHRIIRREVRAAAARRAARRNEPPQQHPRHQRAADRRAHQENDHRADQSAVALVGAAV